MVAVARRHAARGRRLVVSALAVAATVLALVGSLAAVERRNFDPNGIPVSDPKREALPGARGEFGQLSSDGELYVLIEDRAGEPAHQALVVVDVVRGTIVGRFPAPVTGGSLRNAGWRYPKSVWVSAVELSEEGASLPSAHPHLDGSSLPTTAAGVRRALAGVLSIASHARPMGL